MNKIGTVKTRPRIVEGPVLSGSAGSSRATESSLADGIASCASAAARDSRATGSTPRWCSPSAARLDFLGLECLGERTVALAQLRRRKDPAKGYDPLLERRMMRLLPLIKRNGIRLVTNMGAANPLAAADAIIAIARAATASQSRSPS